MMMALPVNIKSNAGQLVFGNEQNFNDKFRDNEGNEGFISFEQSSEGMDLQNKILSRFSGGHVRVQSYVEPLYHLAEMKMLINRYPNMLRFLVSCTHPDVETKKNKWCQNCSDCSWMFTMLSAFGDPADFGFTVNMFDRQYEKFFEFLTKEPSESESTYDRKKKSHDEGLLAFYLAYKNGAKGYLIELFKKTLLKEATAREDELNDIFFGIHHSTSLPKKTFHELKSIFQEELSK
jgi:hypothetical protein